MEDRSVNSVDSDVPAKRSKKFPWGIYFVALFVILTVALAPVGSVIVCSWVANAHGCRVDEGSVHPCVIGGKDYGQLLYTLGVLGWLMIATIPGGALALIVWLIVLILHRASWRRRLSVELKA
jgi:hypothetical protein